MDGRDDSRSPSNIIDCRPVQDAETIDGSERKLTDEEVEGRSTIISSRKLESRSTLLPSTPLKISNPLAPIIDEASVVIVYDVNTGKIHSATSARGEDLIKLTNEGRGEKGGQTVESVEGLKDVVKNVGSTPWSCCLSLRTVLMMLLDSDATIHYRCPRKYGRC